VRYLASAGVGSSNYFGIGAKFLGTPKALNHINLACDHRRQGRSDARHTAQASLNPSSIFRAEEV